MNNTDLLHDLYYVKLNFDGANILYNKAKLINKDISFDFVKDWLNKQATHQQTSNTSKRLNFLPIYSESPFGFQIDLTFFPRYTKQNDGYFILFTAININTRYAYAYYCKSKDAIQILDIMKQFHKDCLMIDTITTDEGTEFKNNFFLKYCTDNDIKVFFCKGDSHKLGIINRFHRTLKDKLLKYFTSQDTVRWIDAIDKIIYNYNHTVNTGINIEPYKVNNYIQTSIIAEKEAETIKMKGKEPDYILGGKCRILNNKGLFDDKMTAQYSNKIYTITKINKNSLMLDNTVHIKKSDVLLITDDTEEIIPEVHQRAVKDHNIVRNKILRSGVNEENIINAPRQRTANPRYL